MRYFSKLRLECFTDTEQRIRRGRSAIRLLLVLAVLGPVNVLYHQVRDTMHDRLDQGVSLLEELSTLRLHTSSPYVQLVEPAGMEAVEKKKRRFIAQYALAPSLITLREARLKLVESASCELKPSQFVLEETPSYTLVGG